MSIRYMMIASLLSTIAIFGAAPITMQVKNGSKKIRLNVQTPIATPIAGQLSYTFEPNETKNIVILNGPGSYVFSVTFLGLNGDDNFAILKVQVNNSVGQKYVISDEWEMDIYNGIIDYMKRRDDPNYQAPSSY